MVPGAKSCKGILKLDCISIDSQLERRQDAIYWPRSPQIIHVPDTMFTLHILSLHFSDKKLRHKEVNLFEVTLYLSGRAQIQAQVYKTLHFQSHLHTLLLQRG